MKKKQKIQCCNSTQRNFMRLTDDSSEDVDVKYLVKLILMNLAHTFHFSS